jgi:hypothetical protein
VGDALRAMGVERDLELVQIEGVKTVEWIHRRSGDAEIYFLCNQENISQHGLTHDGLQISFSGAEDCDPGRDTAKLEVAFRVIGRQPELWDAVTGARRDLPEFQEKQGRTVVPITLAPVGSCFVVLRKPIAGTSRSARTMNFPALKAVATLEGPWTVKFDPRWGGPEQVSFDNLDDWTLRAEEGIKHYSGRATYEKTFDMPNAVQIAGSSVYLDLGTLHSIAEVRCNGKDLGVLWCPPWRVEVTGTLKPAGNKLEIDVINVWANRVIGDAALPEEKRFTWTSLSETISALKPDSKLIPSGLRGPVVPYLEEP